MIAIRSPCTQPPSRGEGFSLVEVLVSIVILAIGLLALLGMQATALRLSSADRELQLARDTTVGLIDEIKTLTNLQLHDPDTAFPAADGWVTTFSGLGEPFQMAGVDTTLPDGYDYLRWLGVEKRDPGGAVHRFVIKLAIDEWYLLQDVLARGNIVVYWKSAGALSERPVDHLQVTFFNERKP